MSTSSGSPHPQRQANASANPKHIGILVIHGMGEANPYDPLDAFARGLYQCYGGPHTPCYTMHTDWKERGSDPSHKQQSWTQAQLLFEPNSERPGAVHLPHLRLAEYYWSPVTKDKMKDIAVLTWLIRTGLEPFRYLNENIAVMEAAAGNNAPVSLVAKTKRGAFIVWREFSRFLFVYPFLLISFVAVALFLAQIPELPTLLKPLQTAMRVDPRAPWVAILIVLRLAILASLSGYFWNCYKWLRRRSGGTGWHPRYNWMAFSGALFLAALLLALPLAVDHRFFCSLMDDSVCPARFTGFAGVFSSWSWLLTYLERFFLVREPFTPLLIPLAELAVAAIIRNFLINFLGDVAIYTNLNQRSANFAMRAQILEECGHALTLLYQDLRKEAGENFEIVIAAHSLGTVIAYDTLNDLFNRARIHAAAVGAKQPLQPGGQSCPSALAICQHMRGMLTFGSPLNKTYYFFRDQSPAGPWSGPRSSISSIPSACSNRHSRSPVCPSSLFSPWTPAMICRS